MKKRRATLVATGLALISQSAFSAASVAVAHFAPFAEDIEDTAVNISVNGSVALENVKFKEYMEGNPTFLTFDSCDAMDDGMGGETCMNSGGFDGMMATTTLYASSGGGPGEDDMVETVRVGEIDFEILTCLDATATVRLDGADPVTYTASQLTAPFPCTEPAPAE